MTTIDDVVRLWQQNARDRAVSACAGLSRREPENFDVLNLLAYLYANTGQPDKAVQTLGQAVHLRPDAAVAHNNLGNALRAAGRAAESMVAYRAALRSDPAYADAHFNLGNALIDSGDITAAIDSYRRVLQLAPGHAAAHYNLGNALLTDGRIEAAEQSFRSALAADPGLAQAHNNLGGVYRQQGRLSEAIGCLQRALLINPNYIDALKGLADAHHSAHEYAQAVFRYRRANELDPTDALTLCNLGIALRRLNDLPAALDSSRRAIALDPGLAEAHANVACVQDSLGDRDAANAGYKAALALKPESVEIRAYSILSDLMLADWREWDAKTAWIRQRIGAGEKVPPLILLSVTDDAAVQLQAARSEHAFFKHERGAPLWAGARHRRDRIRLAYVSPDYCDHPLTYLIAGVFEHHDRSRFETFAISLRPENPGACGQRVKGAFEHFVDVSTLGDLQAARKMRELQIDVAVDLTGFTEGMRPGIFAQRPAPVQVNYLGYPGTLGSEHIDYIIADEFVIPPHAQQFYAEKVMYLPDCFQANDRLRPAAATPTRQAVGLPDSGFVFCCFNNTYKLNPPIFDIWMRLLRAVPGSVLWLSAPQASSQANLRREAAARGIDPQRLILQQRMPYAEYLARMRLADLFLDTLPFNAGTTASDALWVGLPVLTCTGRAFAARMAGSLLRTIGLPELITDSPRQYEALALELATQPARLSAIRATLAANRETHPLFDAPGFTRHLEAAFETMLADTLADNHGEDDVGLAR